MEQCRGDTRHRISPAFIFRRLDGVLSEPRNSFRGSYTRLLRTYFEMVTR